MVFLAAQSNQLRFTTSGPRHMLKETCVIATLHLASLKRLAQLIRLKKQHLTFTKQDNRMQGLFSSEEVEEKPCDLSSYKLTGKGPYHKTSRQ